MLKSKIIFLFFVLFFISCKTVQLPATNEKTTITTTEVIRDTAIIVLPDSSAINALLACDSLGNVYLSQIIAYRRGMNIQEPNLMLRNDTMYITCEVDSFAVYCTWKDRLTTINHDKNETIYIPVERALNGYEKIFIYIGIGVSVLFILFLIYCFIKSKLKL